MTQRPTWAIINPGRALQLNPDFIVRREVTYDTILGPRYADIEVTDPATGTIELVEGKVGDSPYVPSQRAKDFLIERFQGVKTTVVRINEYPPKN